MKINRNITTHIPPYNVVVIDATDAFYYADMMGQWEVFDIVQDLNIAKDLADALFVQKNYKWESLQEMNNVDGGFDVRIYDQNGACVYVAHEAYKENWIGVRRNENNHNAILQVSEDPKFGLFLSEEQNPKADEASNIKTSFNNKNGNEVNLTNEELEVINHEWKLFISALPQEKEKGEWYADKEVIDVMQKSIASEALISLAEDYLSRTVASTSSRTITEVEKQMFLKKASDAAVKAVTIDPHPLNFYKVGTILEKIGEVHQGKVCFQEFLKHAPDLMKNENEKFRQVVQMAIDDVKSKKLTK